VALLTGVLVISGCSLCTGVDTTQNSYSLFCPLFCAECSRLT